MPKNGNIENAVLRDRDLNFQGHTFCPLQGAFYPVALCPGALCPWAFEPGALWPFHDKALHLQPDGMGGGRSVLVHTTDGAIFLIWVKF